MRVRIRRGLNIPLSGPPEAIIEAARPPRAVALLGRDYPGLHPQLCVQVGERVRLGDPLFTDKRRPGVRYTAPAAGVVEAIERGQRRVLQSVIVRLEGDEACEFRAYARAELETLAPAVVREQLLAAGLWTALRTRPYSHVPHPESAPHSLFVTAIDTQPLAPDPLPIIEAAREPFEDGLRVLSHLTEGAVHLCVAPAGAALPTQPLPRVQTSVFDGPHPAGLPGTHIHFLDPVSATRTVWHVGYQDVIAIGRLFTSGRIDPQRTVALAGPMVKRPRLLRTQIGASTADLVPGELRDGECRVLSGSVLSGERAVGPVRFLGRYHRQITVLAEGRERALLGWLLPGTKRFSATRAFAARWWPQARPFDLTTSQNGSPRAMVPIASSYESVMPLDILPALLLKALVVGDTDTAVALGALELDEEDLALLSFVDCGKYEYGPVLRESLERIEAGR